MAKGKRVSNKAPGNQGRRSGNGRDRYWANVRRRKYMAAPSVASVPNVIRSSKVARIPGPSFLGRVTAPIKRFFRSI